jgi:hypothetical protein
MLRLTSMRSIGIFPKPPASAIQPEDKGCFKNQKPAEIDTLSQQREGGLKVGNVGTLILTNLWNKCPKFRGFDGWGQFSWESTGFRKIFNESFTIKNYNPRLKCIKLYRKDSIIFKSTQLCGNPSRNCLPQLELYDIYIFFHNLRQILQELGS